MLVSLLRTVLMYGVILLAVRLLGKRQISQLQASELVATLLLSELAVLPIQEEGLPLWRGLLPMCALVLCELGASWGMLKSGRFRKLVCGSPMVVIQRGKVLQGQMRRLRMTTEDLLEQLRQNNVFYLDEVAYAIIETNGMISVIKYPESDPLTPKQAGVAAPFAGLEAAVVSDGEISDHSLELCGKDRAWVEAKAREAGLRIEDIFLMTARGDGGCKIVVKEKKA